MREDKKVIAAVSIAAAVFSAAVLVSDFIRRDTVTPKQAETDISAPNSQYCIKAYNGKIAVFVDLNAEPIHTLDSPYVRDLPEYDRKLLETGIIAHSNAELLKILEDYDN